MINQTTLTVKELLLDKELVIPSNSDILDAIFRKYLRMELALTSYKDQIDVDPTGCPLVKSRAMEAMEYDPINYL